MLAFVLAVITYHPWTHAHCSNVAWCCGREYQVQLQLACRFHAVFLPCSFPCFLFTGTRTVWVLFCWLLAHTEDVSRAKTVNHPREVLQYRNQQLKERVEQKLTIPTASLADLTSGTVPHMFAQHGKVWVFECWNKCRAIRMKFVGITLSRGRTSTNRAHEWWWLRGTQFHVFSVVTVRWPGDALFMLWNQHRVHCDIAWIYYHAYKHIMRRIVTIRLESKYAIMMSRWTICSFFKGSGRLSSLSLACRSLGRVFLRLNPSLRAFRLLEVIDWFWDWQQPKMRSIVPPRD